MKEKFKIPSGMMFSNFDLRLLIIPLMIEQFLARSVGMLDTLMVASVGEAAVSGVSLVDSIAQLMITLFSSLASGGAIVAGQYLGSKNKEKSGKAAQQLLLTVTGISVIIAAIALIFNQQILNLLYKSVEPSVMGHARSYFYVTAVSFPFIALYDASAALFRGMGNSRISMTNALIMNVINVAGNALFIYKFNLGAFGAGLSTTIARIVAALIMVFMLRNPELPIHVRSYNPKSFDFPMIKSILRIGVPNGLENSIFQVGKLLVASLVATLGTKAITADAVASSLSSIPVGPGSAMGLAATTVVAQCVGAGEYDQADFYAKRLLKMAYAFLAALSALMIVALPIFLGFYQLSDSTYRVARQIVIYHAISSTIAWAPSFTLPNALRAAGDVRFTMVISIVSMFTFRIGLSYLMVHVLNMGVISVWIAMSVDWVFRGLNFIFRWRSGKWKYRAVTED